MIRSRFLRIFLKPEHLMVPLMLAGPVSGTALGECEEPAPETLPIPTNLTHAASSSFGTPIVLGWDDVWTGCGGYEVEFRRAGELTWTSIELASGNLVEINIPLPDGTVTNPTAYSLRVRSFWGSGNDTRRFSEWSAVGTIEMFTTAGGCGTVAPDPLPVPINLMNPATGSFGEPFTFTWDHVWTGCGGYEAEFRRAGSSSWVTIEISSGNGVQLSIPLPSGAVSNPTSYALRVRSFWGTENDVKQFSDWSVISNIAVFTTAGGCETPTPSTLPTPTNLSNPSTGTFGESLTLGWDDVWTGCGGYDAEFRRAGGAAWTRIEIFSGSSVEINIPLPFGTVDDPTSYALRVRSFWRLSNDTRQFSEWSATGNIEIFLSPLRSITFPQLALGGGFEVVLLISNRGRQNWTGTALLREGNDEPWSAPWTLEGESEAAESAFEIALTGDETQRFLLKGDVEAQAGYLSIVPDEGLPASGISVAFFYNFVASGGVTDSIGVIPGQPGTVFTFPVEKTAEADTGIAYVASSSNPFLVIMTLYDSAGTQLQQRFVTYAGHVAQFFGELFQNLSTGFVGKVRVESQERISLVVIRLQSTSTGVQLTTLSTEPSDQ